MGEVIPFPANKELSQGQRNHWEQVLENAERMRENALRVLGRLPIELGIPDVHDGYYEDQTD